MGAFIGSSFWISYTKFQWIFCPYISACVLPRWLTGKESACQRRRCRSHRFKLWVRKIPGGGNGNPLQYSCLGNPVDRGAWWAIVHGVAKRHDWTQSAYLFNYFLGINFYTGKVESKNITPPPQKKEYSQLQFRQMITNCPLNSFLYSHHWYMLISWKTYFKWLQSISVYKCLIIYLINFLLRCLQHFSFL